MATSDDPENFVPQDCFNITIPVSFLTENTTGECSVLVEIDHHDATLLDFEGASGAIGRFEADENGRELCIISQSLLLLLLVLLLLLLY